MRGWQPSSSGTLPGSSVPTPKIPILEQLERNRNRPRVPGSHPRVQGTVPIPVQAYSPATVRSTLGSGMNHSAATPARQIPDTQTPASPKNGAMIAST